jgi:hypothetical protein
MTTLDAGAWLLAAVLAAVVAWLVWRRRDGLGLGLLLAGASLSGVTAPLLGAGVRIEQPAVALVGVLLIWSRTDALRRLIRSARVPIILGCLYLAANVASALLYAPDQAQSLKIAAWTGLSLTACLVSAGIAASSSEVHPERTIARLVVASACLHAAVAIVQVVAELAIQSDWGVLRSDSPIAKAFGLAWDPNLLAIHLGAALTLVVDPRGEARRWPPLVFGATTVLIAAGIALSLSRGGIVAFLVGSFVLIVGFVRPATRSLDGLRPAVPAMGLALAVALGGYVGLSSLADLGVGLRPGETSVRDAGPQGTLEPLAATPGSGAASTSGPRPSGDGGGNGGLGPGAGRSIEPRRIGAGDTIELRWRNLQVAVSDAARSPLIGLGPDTFGQRYAEPTCDCPAHIPNQLSATLYESGLVGLISLALIFGWVIVHAWRIRLDGYVAALVAMAAGFQFTDAIRFGFSWILLGTMIGLVVRADQRGNRRPSATW